MSKRTDTIAIQGIAGVVPDGIWGPKSAAAVLGLLLELGSNVSADKKFDARTESNLAELLPAAQDRFRAFTAAAQNEAAKMGCQYVAICGFRTYEEQDALYAKGRTKPGPKVTKARGGSSWHNFKVAVDYGVFKDGKYLDSDDPNLAARVHKRAGLLAAKYGIEWGGNWKKFKDAPHYQVALDISLAEARRLKANGKEVM